MDDLIKKYLVDMLNSINSIEDFLGIKKYYEHYKSNRQLKRAIERELEIIGEALNKAMKIDPKLEIKNGRKIIQIRNIIAHAYDSVDDEIIWSIIINHLPKLKIEIENLMSSK